MIDICSFIGLLYFLLGIDMVYTGLLKGVSMKNGLKLLCNIVLFTTVLLTFSSCPDVTIPTDDDPIGIEFHVENTTQWNNALSQIRNGGDNRSYNITVSGDIGVPGISVNSFGSVTNLSVAIKGKGKLYLTGQGSMIYLGANQTLYVEDIALEGLRKDLNGDQDNNAPAVELWGGNFYLKGSSSIYSNSSGGVRIQENASFTMQDNASVHNNTTNGGGGGIMVIEGSLIMQGSSTVHSNTTFMGGGGGGVGVYSGIFTMQDNTSVHNNTANGNGGGVHVWLGGTLIMQDNSSINNNEAVYGSGAGDGGGIFVRGGGGGIGNAILQDNSSLYGNKASRNGGGIFAYDNGVFQISGGIIHGNSSELLSNTASVGAALFRDTHDISPGIAQFGTFNNGFDFNKNGDLNTTNETIFVIDGELYHSQPSVTSVNVSPSTASVVRGQTQQFSATVSGAGNPAQTVTWTVTGGGTGTSINSSGLLTVAENETATSLTVRATSTVNTYISGTATITVLQPVPENRFEYFWVNEHDSLVTTSGGVVSIAAGETLTITAQSTGYIVRQWHLNGVNTGHSENTYNFTSTATGRHTVGLFVEKDGRLYNTNITIMVQ